MRSSKHHAKKLCAMLTDSEKPAETRAQMLVAAFQSGEPDQMLPLATELLEQMKHGAPAAQFEELKAAYQQVLTELEEGGVRPCTYVGHADGEMPGPKPRLHVVTPDGQERFPFLHESVKLEDLRAGMTAYLDAKGTVVLGFSRSVPRAGPQAMFVRDLPGTGQVEISIRDEIATFYASAEILDAVAAGDLNNGDSVLICPQRQFVFRKVPENKDRHHRFVDRHQMPDIDPSQDIGNPHWCLPWLIDRTRTLLFRDDLRTRFKQRPRVSLLMTGPSGTGKTLTIKAYLTAFRGLLIERTGLDDIESRVIRVKMSEHLSEWLGRSDKNFDRLFDDVQQLASEEIETASGERIRLPVTLIFEEVDGLAQRRSTGDHDGTSGIMDRVMGTLLQRLDDPLDELGKLNLIIISTSNRPKMIDVAMQRRLGGTVARFGRLDRDGLAAVLGKKIDSELPLASQNGTPQKVLRQQLIDEVVASFFSPANDQPRVELTLRDGTKIERYSRDFLTGAVVEQGLSDALDQLVRFALRSGREDVGLDSAIVVNCLHRQIDALSENLAPFNAGDYVDVPEHTQVANVRRVQQTGGRLSQLVARR